MRVHRLSQRGAALAQRTPAAGTHAGPQRAEHNNRVLKRGGGWRDLARRTDPRVRVLVLHGGVWAWRCDVNQAVDLDLIIKHKCGVWGSEKRP
jgi:hypothetical protein